MSDTPITDAAWKARLIAVSEQRAEDEPTMFEFARQLERECAHLAATQCSHPIADERGNICARAVVERFAK